MGVLRTLFGPSQEEIWSQIAADIGGKFEEGGFLGRDAIRYRSGDWELLLDTYAVSTGKTTVVFTRMRAPFVNRDGLYFKIYREGLFSGAGRFFGMQDILVGDSFFDDQFVIKGNSEEKIRQLLADGPLKNHLQQQKDVLFEIKDDDGFFGERFPAGTDMLYFQCVGVLKEERRLRGLFDLFAHTLNRLVAIDSAYEDDPRVRLSP